jgi:CrcB protein
VNVLAVLAGGLIGTAMRLGIDALLPHAHDGFPWSTLLINVIGSFALGMLVARVWPVAPDWLRLGLGTGLLGAFTTFSALVVSAFSLLGAAQPMLALLYLGATLVAGIAAAFLGLRIGNRPPPAIGPEE